MKKQDSILKFEEKKLVKRLAKNSLPIRVAFASACAERLCPRYREYYNKTGVGDPTFLEQTLSLIWADLTGEKDLSKSELDDLIAKCETLYLDDSKPWIHEANFVEDAIASVQYALECRNTGDAQAAAWAARRAYEDVDAYITYKHDIDLNSPKDLKWTLEHPLVQAEFHRQQRDLAELETSVANFEMIRNRARAESAIFFDEQAAQQYLEMVIST